MRRTSSSSPSRGGRSPRRASGASVATLIIGLSRPAKLRIGGRAPICPEGGCPTKSAQRRRRIPSNAAAVQLLMNHIVPAVGYRAVRRARGMGRPPAHAVQSSHLRPARFFFGGSIPPRHELLLVLLWLGQMLDAQRHRRRKVRATDDADVVDRALPVSKSWTPTCPRSRPGHGPEVGPPVLLFYGDVSRLPVWRTAARAPRISSLGDGARAAALGEIHDQGIHREVCTARASRAG